MWDLNHKEDWAPKNWCLLIVVLEKTLESPLDCKQIKPVHPKEINFEYSLKGLMLKLNLQNFGHLMGREDLLEKSLKLERVRAGGEGIDRGRDGWMASPRQWTWVWASSGSWWRAGKPSVLQPMESQRVGHDWATFTLNSLSDFKVHEDNNYYVSISLARFNIILTLLKEEEFNRYI